MKDKRPDPQQLLKRIQQEETKHQKGKLKIYLGAAPGVGKTYEMLQDALEQKAQGRDVVVGVVESHGRSEIDALLAGWETIPKQSLAYHGQSLLEFDLDAALARRPGLILMDEMAHTNAPGLRHGKRWQDIKELLDRGIDVYTTLNVQHIESLNDVVSQIIHTRVKETIPDFMLDLANMIELVDLPQEELLKRLKEGKIYLPRQAEIAVDHFFRKGNLTALRELALRITAERVSEEVLDYRQGLGIQHIWPTKEKLLVCVGPNIESNKLIRAAARMSSALQAEWTAVHVSPLTATEQEQAMAIQNLRLAEQLGGHTKILTGPIVSELIHFAREQNITKIILGKHKAPSFWHRLFFQNTTEAVLKQSGEIDVYLIDEGTKALPSPEKPTARPKKHSLWWYALSMSVVALATAINWLLSPYLLPSNLIMVYLLGMVLVALFGRAGPAFGGALLSMAAYHYFFIAPQTDFSFLNIQWVLPLLAMLLITQVICHFTFVVKRQAALAHQAEKRTATLHTLSRQLASTRGTDQLMETAVRFIAETFDSTVLALLEKNGHLALQVAYQTEKVINEKEHSVAQWAYDLGQPAGLGTDTLPFLEALYVPLLTSQGAIGALRLQPYQEKLLFTPEQMHLLEACANQIALAIEVDRLQEQSKQTEFQKETDRLRSALLRSVAHDIRTPLVAAMASASTLMEMSKQLGPEDIKKMGTDIYFELEQFNRLMNNLLQITYLESEKIELQKTPCPLKSFIHAVLEKEIHREVQKPISVQVPDGLQVPIDQALMRTVVINLIDNALKFTAPNTPIEIVAKVEEGDVLISVGDRGPGIVPDEANKLFEKFYRGRLLSSERGLGLGLAICRSLIKAHGGAIWAENRPSGGAVFYFKLPLN